MKIIKLLGLGAFTVCISNAAMAAAFVNGGFEDGDASGWTTGGGYRGNTLNSSLSPADILPGGMLYDASSSRSAIITAGTLDPNLGAALGSTVYSGNYSYRAENTIYGGYASAISQQVQNYTDANIFFAWKAVLENGGHTADESAEFTVVLHDDTTNTDLISRVYNAGSGGGGVDTRFSSLGNLFYTSQWQIEQITIDSALSGHDFTLSLLAADCEPTGHTGYAYLDGFGALLPVGEAPLPGTLALLGIGLMGFGATGKRQRKLPSEA